MAAETLLYAKIGTLPAFWVVRTDAEGEPKVGDRLRVRRQSDPGARSISVIVDKTTWLGDTEHLFYLTKL